MQKVLLILIFLLGLGLRLISLSTSPIGFTPDEASFGYDAYSLLKTGKDQWGNTLPLAFKSFGDYKLPVYGYLTVPFVWAIGLNEFATRLPNALFGSFAILVTYFLVRELTEQKFEKIALFAALLLAISPWHVPLSRGAFEANLTSFFLPLGILFFLKGLKNSKLLYLAAFAFGINLFTYHSARLVTPLIVAFLVFMYRKSIFQKKNIVQGAIFTLFFAVAGFSYFSGSGARAGTSVILNPTDGWTGVGSERYLAVIAGENPFVARVFNNKLVYVTSTFLENYLSYFSDEFLFINGPRESTYGMVPGRGVLYLFELPLLLFFIWGLVRGKVRDVEWLIFWILVSPIPAAIAKGPGGAANRAGIMIPALEIAASIGAILFISSFQKQFSKGYMKGVVVGIILVSFLFSAEDYFIGQKVTGATSMVYGAREIITSVSLLEKDYSRVVISRKLSEPHIYVAFFTKVDPVKFQEASKDWNFEEQGFSWVDQMPEYSLDNYTFKYIDKIVDFKTPDILLVGSFSEFDEGTEYLKKIDYPTFAPAYMIVDPIN